MHEDRVIEAPDGLRPALAVIDRDGGPTASSFPVADCAGDAWHDTLTGLGNRRHFNRMLRQVLQDATVTTPHAVLLIDLDRFAPVNEAFGEAVGDGLLCQVAKILRREGGDGDLLARLGGDKFAFLTRYGSTAESLAAGVITALRRPFALAGQRVSIGASVGVVRLHGPGLPADDLLRRAELALYEAKSAGGSTWRCFDAARADELQSRRELETALQKALALGELSLLYHAPGEAVGSQPSGFEARLQWHHPIRGVLQERDFLPQAANTRQIAALDDWKLRTACVAATRWPKPLMVAVRLAARQLGDGDGLLGSVKAALGESGLSPWRLQLHVAETILQNADPEASSCLHSLRALGVQIVPVDAASEPAAPNLLSGMAVDAGDRSLHGARAEARHRQASFYPDDPVIPASAIIDLSRRHGFAGQPLSARA